MSSERQTKYGRSSYRLVREQRMLAKGQEQRKNEFASTCPSLSHYSLICNLQFQPRNP